MEGLSKEELRSGDRVLLTVLPWKGTLANLSDILSERYPCEIPEMSGNTCLLAKLPGD